MTVDPASGKEPQPWPQAKKAGGAQLHDPDLDYPLARLG